MASERIFDIYRNGVLQLIHLYIVHFLAIFTVRRVLAFSVCLVIRSKLVKGNHFLKHALYKKFFDVICVYKRN